MAILELSISLYFVLNSFETLPLSKGLARRCWSFYGRKIVPGPQLILLYQDMRVTGQGPCLPCSLQGPTVPGRALAQSDVFRKIVYCCLAQGMSCAQRKLQRPIGPQGERKDIIMATQGWTLKGGMLTGEKVRNLDSGKEEGKLRVNW